MVTRWLQPLQTLHARFLLALAFIAILPLGIAGLSIAVMDRGALAEQSSRELTGLARGLAGQLSTFLDGSLNNAQGFAALPQIVSMDPAQQKPLLDELFQRHPEFSTLVTFDLSGRVLASTPPRNLPGVAEREAFQSAALRGQQDWMVVRGIDTKRSILLIHTPIRDAERRVVGVLGATVDLENLSSAVGKVPIGGGGQAFVLDPSGYVLLHQDQNVVQQQPSFSRLGIPSGGLPVGAGTVRYESDEGRQIAGYAPVPDTGWMVVVERPEKEVLAAAARSWQLAILGLLTSSLIALVAAIVIARLLTRPLRQMAQAVRAVGAGDWATPLPEAREAKGELGALVEAFSTMREEVQDREESLRLLAQEKAVMAEEEAVMAEIGRVISSSLDVDEVYASFAEQVRRLIPWDRISVSLLDPEAGTFTSTYYQGLTLQDRERGAVSSLQGSLTEWVLRARCGLLVQNEDGTELARKIPALVRSLQAGLRSFISVPLVSNHEVIGALHLRSSEDNAYTERHLKLAESVGTQIAGAIASAQLYRQRQRAEEALRESHRDLEKALAELSQAQRQAIQQERLGALGQMASGVAHDFNNALSPIMGYSDLLLMNPGYLEDQNKARDCLQCIRTAAHTAGDVVRRLREFYRPREDTEEFQPVELNWLVQETISLTQPRWQALADAQDSSVNMVSDLAEVPEVSGSESQLRDLLTNLIFNAVDAMPDGGTLTLRTQGDGSQVVLQVEDTGMGMAEEVRRRCLEPWFTTKGDQGTGLGLAMVYGIIQRHGGDIDIKSKVGEGTTFTIRLPAQPETGGVTGPSSNEKTATPAVVWPLRVLVVDDAPEVRRVLADYLTVDGHRVEVAANGKQGLQKFLGSGFDLAVVDLAMPELSGTQLTAIFKQLTPGIMVISLSGFGDLLERSSSADLILSKPVTLDELRQAVAKVMTAPGKELSRV